MIWQLLLQALLIFCNAVFACAEIAVISVNDAKLDKLASSGNKKAKRLKKLTAEPSRFLATIQVAITLSGFIGSAFAADNFADRLVNLVQKTGLSISPSILRSLSVIVITLILSYFTLVFGELVPKRLAMKKAEPMALGMSGMIDFISKLFAPIVWLLNVSTNGILYILGINPNNEDDSITEEEILMMSDAGAEKGTIDEDDNRIIKNIFAFDDISVEQLCTHRTDVVFLSEQDSDEKWAEIIHNSFHSKFPIYSNGVDRITGILDARIYYRLADRSRENIMKHAVKEPFFVHENMKADVLFDAMKMQNAEHFAIVIDEYGGVCGIITVTDLVEQLVGDFSEESFDNDFDRIEKTDDNAWIAGGMVPLTEAAEAMNIHLPTDKFDTLSGYLLSFTNVFPKDNEKTVIITDALQAELIEIKNHRIIKCRLSLNNSESSGLDE